MLLSHSDRQIHLFCSMASVLHHSNSDLCCSLEIWHLSPVFQQPGSIDKEQTLLLPCSCWAFPIAVPTSTTRKGPFPVPASTPQMSHHHVCCPTKP